MFRLGHGLGLSSFSRERLLKDIVAGIVLATLLVPQGMAYAELAGLPPITGLYTTILCLLAYAVFGPSRILVLGPDSSLGPMIAATVLPLVALGRRPAERGRTRVDARDDGRPPSWSWSVAKLGFIADLISKPTMIGYMNGLAITILVGQLPKLFGFSVTREASSETCVGFVEGVADGEDGGPAAAAVGIAGIVLILVLQRGCPRFRRCWSWWCSRSRRRSLFDLADQGVSLVGDSPRAFRRSRSRR